MGRQPSYAPQEDAIIIDTTGLPWDETNARLHEAGFETRTKDAIQSRRAYLKRSNPAVEFQRPVEGASTEDLIARKEALERTLVEAREALVRVSEELQERLEKLSEDVRRNLASDGQRQ